MMLSAGLALIVIAGTAAFAVTYLVLRHAVRLGVVQTPNGRSSHTRPTASGGGVGIVVGGTLGGLFAGWFQPWPTLLIVLLSVAIAAVGFMDDRRPLPARWRLVTQLLLVAIMVAVVPLPALATAIGLSVEPLILAIVLILASVYWLNIFNFMDGIDGLAASEAAFMLLGAALLAASGGSSTEAPHLWWMLALAAAALGFLVLNFPPARIFMGDAGSTYLGFMLAFLALQTVAAGWLTPWQWLILAGIFVADATITLVRRLMLGERVFEAHRRHAYQILSRRWRAHRPVTLLAVVVNVGWLLPLAWWAGTQPSLAWLALVAAYLPLMVGAFWVGAGAPEKKLA